jgi:hypothetical protein
MPSYIDEAAAAVTARALTTGKQFTLDDAWDALEATDSTRRDGGQVDEIITRANRQLTTAGRPDLTCQR